MKPLTPEQMELTRTRAEIVRLRRAQGARATADARARHRARHKAKFKVTTDVRHGLPIALNLLARHFTPAACNQVWGSGITYWWTDEGWLYLPIVLDLFNRKVVGWSLKPRMATNIADIADIVMDALTMAWFSRKPVGGVLHH